MKIREARIRNFKGIRDETISFAGRDGSPRWLTVLAGDNGSGKTTVLQAIALVLSRATRKTSEDAAFRWQGFRADRLSTLGPTRVELDVVFEPREIEKTASLFERFRDARPPEDPSKLVPPSKRAEVTLVYDRGSTRLLAKDGGFPALLQFLGRYYVGTLRRNGLATRAEYHDLGDVFWFDQYRNLGTTRAQKDEAPETWVAGVEQLRQALVGWWGYHTSPQKDPERDFLARLERQISVLFPGTRFAGIEARQDGPDFDFLFERDGKLFDLAELSSGEQTVFSLLFEFVRLDIAHSVVLVDELELHLHPPEQQALLSLLPKLGDGCQLIATTHSRYLLDAVPDEEVHRLSGGRPCL